MRLCRRGRGSDGHLAERGRDRPIITEDADIADELRIADRAGELGLKLLVDRACGVALFQGCDDGVPMGKEGNARRASGLPFVRDLSHGGWFPQIRSGKSAKGRLRSGVIPSDPE
jgi:hypothetical protein